MTAYIRFFQWILERVSDEEIRLSIIEHMDLEYAADRQERGSAAAGLRYVLRSLRILLSLVSEDAGWRMSMFASYVKAALRHIRHQKMYSLINVGGFSIGLAAALLILLFVRDEVGFDRFHANFDRTYRVVMEVRDGDGVRNLAVTALPLAPALRAEIPEILNVARFSDRGTTLVSRDDRYFYEDLAFAEPELNEIFSFPFLSGDPRKALSDPDSICLSETMARKYFGNADPLGQVLVLQNQHDFKVTGVFRDIPTNSHLQFDFLVSYATLRNEPRMTDWDSLSNDYTYVAVAKDTDPIALESKLQGVLERHVPPEDAAEITLRLQPLGDKAYIYIFPAIGALILLIACLNFMSLSTARSAKRAKEVGLRKVIGARRTQLIRQFFVESMSMTLVSMVLASGLVFCLLPRVNDFVRKSMAFDPLRDGGLLVGLTAIGLVVGFVSGVYPALFLSSFEPARILRAQPARGARRVSFRTVTVVFQFSVSIILIIGTTVVFSQLRFMTKKNPGFPADRMLVVSLSGSPAMQNIETLRNEVLGDPSILSATASNSAPASGVTMRGDYEIEGSAEGRKKTFQIIQADQEFVRTYDLKIAAGRDFSREYTTDRIRSVLINETAARELGWDFPVGKRLKFESGEPLSVIGVVKDFNYDGMQSQIPGMVITLGLTRPRYLSLRIRPENTKQVLAFVERIWQAHAPRYPFSYFFIDEEFGKFYRFERRLGTVFTVCAVVAVLISCLGILGLSSFFAELRTKEIGIRKVLGASVSGVIGMMSRDFVKLVALANLIAWPAAYLIMNRWLQDFAFRIKMNVWMFILSGAAALALALLTTGSQAFKAATSNPVTSLRNE
jgi:putative ABC transport system permease protein